MTKATFFPILYFKSWSFQENLSDRAALCLGALRTQGVTVASVTGVRRETENSSQPAGANKRWSQAWRRWNGRWEPRPGGEKPSSGHTHQNFLLSQSSGQTCSGGTCLSWRNHAGLGRKLLDLNVGGNWVQKKKCKFRLCQVTYQRFVECPLFPIFVCVIS